MIIYCDTKGIATSVPSSVPFGASLFDITIMTPKTSATVILKLKPPTGEYLPDIVCTPTFDSEGMSVFIARLPKNATNVSGRCTYQIEYKYGTNEQLTSFEGSFNVSRGVLVDMPETVEQLKQSTIDEIYSMLSNVTLVYREISNVRDIIGDNTLETVAQTLTGAINEINEIAKTINFRTDKTLTFSDGFLSVNTATKEDRDLPIKAADVDVVVGNIEILLETI